MLPQWSPDLVKLCLPKQTVIRGFESVSFPKFCGVNRWRRRNICALEKNSLVCILGGIIA